MMCRLFTPVAERDDDDHDRVVAAPVIGGDLPRPLAALAAGERQR
jgi:hypothetical protein